MPSARPLALLAAIALPAAARADIIYHNDFENSVIGPGWSTNAHLDQAGPFTKFMGRYSENVGTVLNNSVSLTLPLDLGGSPAGYSLSFDFYAIDSWDGNSTTNGPDLMEVTINTVNYFSYTFSNSSASQSYPFPPDVTGYLGFNPGDRDSIYRNITIPFTIGSANEIVIKWRSNGLQGVQDESWGIDNVTVSVNPTPTPGTLALLGMGGAVLGFRPRRK